MHDAQDVMLNRLISHITRQRYLIRVDDVCPTMRWERWVEIEQLFLDYGVKPILAVIPDNQDKTLHQGAENKLFWNEVRAWQLRGWTIGLHGYQHLYVTQSQGLVGLNRYSEFAGLPFTDQYLKLTAAVQIFEREGVTPDVWVAPAHTFDEETVRALQRVGITKISDGFHILPYTDSNGMFWIPQQFGKFYQSLFGIWTVCIHLDDPLYARSGYLERKVKKLRNWITDVSEIQTLNVNQQQHAWDKGITRLIHWSKQLSRMDLGVFGKL